MFFTISLNEKVTVLRAVCRWPGLGKQRGSTLLSRARMPLRKEAHIKNYTFLKRFSTSIRKIKFCTREALRRSSQKRLKVLIERRLYRAKRLEMGLPVRGQRTKNNSKTAKRRINL